MSETPPPDSLPESLDEIADLRGVPHTAVEDIYGIFIGGVLIALGLYLLRMAGLITGGVAGIALMVSYFVPLSAGQLFAIINLPIFLAFWRMLGTAYILRTIVATIAIMGLVQVVAQQMMIAAIAPPMAALVGGTVTGMGVLAVTRHATGVGGSAVIARWLSRLKGWNFGAICMGFDAMIVAVAFIVLGPDRGIWSLVAALSMNAVVLVWHRPDRYLADS